jgi:uncharacterized protein (TIGR00255 family)
MIKSMTGYGKSELELPNKKITIEIKSLNSKQLDINSRFPGVYKEKDLEVRRLISERVVRGKVDFNLYCENLGTSTNAVINKNIVMSYFAQIKELYGEVNLEITDRLIQTIMRLPDAVKIEHEELDEAEWKQIREQIIVAIQQLDEFRAQEGEMLMADMLGNITSIRNLKEQVPQFEPERIERIKTRLNDAFKEASANVQADLNRFEQEMIFYLEKLDVNEEMVRLENHCKYFIETLEREEFVGKKIGFITQEIGREINTLGSKANHTEIQKLVIQMKDALEKIKEQSLNVL